MASQATKMFSKLLTHTDINKRLAIPAKILPSLPDFNASYAVKVHLMYGTKTWLVACTIRKKGYKKPVFSGGSWINFVTCNGINVGDRITMYKVGGSSHYRVEVEKQTSDDRYHAPSNHDFESETGLMMLANVATGTFVDRVLAEPSMMRIFGTNMSDTEEAHFKTEMKCSSNCITLNPKLTPYVGEVNLDLTLAQPISVGVIVEGPEQ